MSDMKALLFSLLITLASVAQGQTYPTKPIRWVVPSAAASPTA